MRKGVIAVGVVVAAGAAAALYSRSRSENDKPWKLVEVTRGPVVEKALAVGAIRPKREIAVKSKISGIVRRAFREVGDHVNVGDPLFEILPDPTPLELTEARREVEIAQNIYEQAKKRSDRTASLSKQGIVSNQDSDQADKEIQDAQIRLNLAQERLRAGREGARAHLRPERGVDHPRARLRHRARAAGQRGRPRGPPHLLPGGHRAHHPGRHVAAHLQGHRRRDRRGQAEGRHARAHQGRGDARRGRAGHRLQDRAQVQDRGRGHAVRRGDHPPAGHATWCCARGTPPTPTSWCARRRTCCSSPSGWSPSPRARRRSRCRPPGEGEPVKKEIKVGLSDGINIEVAEGLQQKDQVVERPPKKIE